MATANRVAGEHPHPSATAVVASWVLGLQRTAHRRRGGGAQTGAAGPELVEVGFTKLGDDSEPDSREDTDPAAMDRAWRTTAIRKRIHGKGVRADSWSF